eukprot:gene32-biopygen7735
MEDSSFSCPSCPYCLEDLGHCGGPTTLPCGHNGCLECFTLIVNSRDPSCPLCRIPLDPNVPLKQNSQFKEVLEALARLASYVSELCLGTAPSPLLTISNELSPSPTSCKQSRAEEECKWPLHPDSLCQASKGGHLECLSDILEHVARVLGPAAPANMVNLKAVWARRSALHESVVSGQRGCVAALLEAGAKSDEVDAMGDSPLVSATERECVNALLVMNAKVDVQTKDRRTPLHVAAQEGHAACVEALLVGGANVDAQDHKLEAPLHLAAHRGHLACVKALLDSGAIVDAMDEMGQTPLLLAIDQGHTGCVMALVDSGAMVEAEDKQG